MIPKTTDLLAMATRFQVDAELRIEKRGEDSWAVCSDTGACLNTLCEMEYEPSPSNRDDEFIARARYTLAGAFEQIARYRDWQRSFPLKTADASNWQKRAVKEAAADLLPDTLVSLRLGHEELGSELMTVRVLKSFEQEGQRRYLGKLEADMQNLWGRPAGTEIEFSPGSVFALPTESEEQTA